MSFGSTGPDRQFRHAIALAAVLTLCGCSEDADVHPPLVRADSAGVELVSVQFDEGSATRWRVRQDPLLEIGHQPGNEDQLLHNVTSAVLLDGGDVVLANAGSFDLRYYDPHGELIRRVGREGDGPGEFRHPRFVTALPRDSVLVFDYSHHRLTLFAPSGDFADSWTTRVADAPPIHVVAGHLDSGKVVVRGFIGNDPQHVGAYLAPEIIGVFDRAEQRFSAIDTISGSELAQVERDGSLLPAILPFGRKSDVAGIDEWIFALDAANPKEIRVHAPDRGLIRVIRVDEPLRPVTDARAEAWVESFFENMDFQLEEVADMWRYGFANVALPDSIPLFRSLAPDPAGVCAERYGLLETAGLEYWCFSPDGEPQRVIRIPSGIRRSGFPHQDFQVRIGADFVLGLWRDELGVEILRLYELVKDGPAR